MNKNTQSATSSTRGEFNSPEIITLIGYLDGRLCWYFQEGSDPPVEIANCRIRVRCPRCRRLNSHGYELDGTVHVDQLKASHCHCGIHRYHVRPFEPGEAGFELHQHSPLVAVSRPARRRRR